MIKNRILERISSKFIIQTIFNYIEDTKFKLKLINYSKSFQKKLDINLINYMEEHIKYVGIDLKKIFLNKLFRYSNYIDKQIKYLNQNILNKNIDINIDTIIKIVVNYLKNYYQNLEKNNDLKFFSQSSQIYINIYCPFFVKISKSELFQYLTIPILNLKEDNLSIFNKLNKLNLKYTSLKINIENKSDINYLIQNNIKFEEIKKLILSSRNSFFKKNVKGIFKSLFHGIEKNLIYLNLNNISQDSRKINSFENINNFKSLKCLKLKGFKFINTLILELPNLIKISLHNCENISFSGNCYLNIKKISLLNSYIVNQNSLLKFPNIEIFKLSENNFRQKYSSIIDFKSFKNLKFMKGELCDFINLENTLLKKVNLYSNIDCSYEIEKKMIEKLILINTLKSIKFEFNKINDEEISKIKGENRYVNFLRIKWNNIENDCILYNLQNKFSNVCDIDLETSLDFNNKEEKTLNIYPNPNSKTRSITIDGMSPTNISIFCCPYEDLKSLFFIFEYKIVNLKDSLPIFNDKCPIIFQSLKQLYLIMDIDLDIFRNIYNNIDYMPNLEKIYLYSFINNLDKIFYEKFIKKILHLKLCFIHLEIRNNISSKKSEKYTLNELKEITNDINCIDYERVNIKKL